MMSWRMRGDDDNRSGLFLRCIIAPRAVLAQDASNVVFILSDDLQNDLLGVHENMPDWTPTPDRISREGAHLVNAFVTTSLCSPSRASILTG